MQSSQDVEVLDFFNCACSVSHCPYILTYVVDIQVSGKRMKKSKYPSVKYDYEGAEKKLKTSQN